jgi:hypothetical protein
MDLCFRIGTLLRFKRTPAAWRVQRTLRRAATGRLKQLRS